jgi:hypothetical protein
VQTLAAITARLAPPKAPESEQVYVPMKRPFKASATSYFGSQSEYCFATTVPLPQKPPKYSQKVVLRGTEASTQFSAEIRV